MYTVITMNPEELKQSLEKIAKNRVHHENDSITSSDNPQELYSWEAPLRAYKRKPAGVLRFYIAVAVLLSIITYFFREYILIIPIWATVFLVYVLTITPPPKVRNAVMKFGIFAVNNTYPWETLSHFYFIKKFDYNILVVLRKAPGMHPLYLVMPDKKTKAALLELLSDYLIYQEEPKKTLTDKLAEWLTTLMPEEESRAES
jgi:hypothetical protein